MKVGLVGLGKLGLPVALAVESRGHQVCGFDVSGAALEKVRRRRLAAPEQDAEELLARSRLRLLAPDELVASAEIVFIVVQTPHEPELDGVGRLPPFRRDFDYTYLRQAARAIGEAARRRRKRLTVGVMSTVLPGTMEREVAPLIPPPAGLAYNPVFTGMGSTIQDFLNPELVLLGLDGRNAGDAGEQLCSFYRTLHDSPIVTTDVRSAELIKVAYNTFIGQKIVFANAMMELCHKVGADVDALHGALSLARERIVSPRYMAGGMGDGGPCHPRDHVALSWLAGEVGLAHDIFSDVMQARERQTEWLADLIEESANGLPIIILGKAYKPETSLVDGSPALLLASILRERGIEFSQYDGHVDGAEGPLEERPPCLFFIATRHPEYRIARFPAGSVVLDPWGYVPDREGVSVIRIGRR